MQERTPIPIARVEALIVSVPADGNAFAEGAEETLLVRITDENGLYGIGESPCTPKVIKAMVEQETIHFWSQGIGDVLVGADPVEAPRTSASSQVALMSSGRMAIPPTLETIGCSITPTTARPRIADDRGSPWSGDQI